MILFCIMNGRAEVGIYPEHTPQRVRYAIDAMTWRSHERGGFVLREQVGPITQDLGANFGRVLDIFLHTQPHIYPEVSGVLQSIMDRDATAVFWTNGEVYRSGFHPMLQYICAL